MNSTFCFIFMVKITVVEHIIDFPEYAFVLRVGVLVVME